MKNFYKIFIVAILYSSCSSLLEVEAENSLTDDFFVDESSLQTALRGAYFNMYGIYDGSSGGELLGGDFQIIPMLLMRTNQEIAFQTEEFPNYARFATKDLNNTNLRVELNWTRGYETISLANNILERLDLIDDQEVREEIEGQALGIRGIMYFELVRLFAPQYQINNQSFGAIPLRLNAINEKSDIGVNSLASIGDVYDQIEIDLSVASEKLINKNLSKDRVSYYAVEAYRARVALQKNDFQQAETHLNNVINGGFSLNPNPLNSFNNISPTNEEILVVEQNTLNNTGNLSTATGLATMYSALENTGFYAIQILPDFFRFDSNRLNNFPFTGYRPNNPEFDPIDERVTFTGGVLPTADPFSIQAAYYQITTNELPLACSKYLSESSAIPLIRLSEMYLSRAEAIIEQEFFSPINANALQDLNLIRQRAGLPALLDTLSPFAFYDSIIVERNREFVFEGSIFHDLKRWKAGGNNVEVGFFRERDPLSELYILPIPQSECDASPGLCD